MEQLFHEFGIALLAILGALAIIGGLWFALYGTDNNSVFDYNVVKTEAGDEVVETHTGTEIFNDFFGTITQ